MSGATLEFDAAGALAVINEAAEALGDPRQMLKNMGEYLQARIEDRFRSGAPGYQTAPDGTPWKALSPGYLRRKQKNQDKILVLEGGLAGSFRYQVGNGELLVGTNRIYGAIHHFGGIIDFASRPRELYFRQGKDGEINNRFASKRKSNFSQIVNVGSYKVQIPARPFMGVSDNDEYALVNIAMNYLMSGAKGGD